MSMNEIRATLGLIEPSTVSPDTTVEFILQYANRNKNVTHRLQTITISPTWDLSQEQTHEVDHSVPAGTKQRVLTTPVETPPGLGGRHGIYVSFEVKAVTEDGAVHSETHHTDDPLTVPVTGARQFRAVVCSAGNDEVPRDVRRVIEQWGFDTYVAEDVQSVRARLTEFDDSPPLFIGVMPTSGDDAQGRRQVSNAVWAANENAKLSIVLADQGISLPELPPETAVFSCQLADQRELLRVMGPELLVERRALETGQSSRLNKLLSQTGGVAKQESKELLRALAYATLLEAAGITPQAVLDSLEVSNESWIKNEPAQIHRAGPWPMRGANIANTGHQPRQSGPTSSVTLQWSVETGDGVRSSPAVANGTIYIGSDDGKVYALDSSTGQERWVVETGDTVTSSPAVANGTVYVGSFDTNIYAIDANTGQKCWTVETGAGVYASPVIADDTVYIGSRDNNVYAIEASTGRECWRVGELWGLMWSSPALADGIVYIGSRDGKIYALDANTGKERWTVEIDGAVNASPAVAKGTVYVGSMDHNVYALDAETGDELWRFETSGKVRAAPSVADGTVFVTNDGVSYDLLSPNPHRMYALDASTGQKCWTFEMDGAGNSSPAVVDGTVYFGSNNNNVYALDASTGQTRWTVETGKRVQSSPAVADGTVYVGSWDNTVYALTEP